MEVREMTYGEYTMRFGCALSEFKREAPNRLTDTVAAEYVQKWKLPSSGLNTARPTALLMLKCLRLPEQTAEYCQEAWRLSVPKHRRVWYAMKGAPEKLRVYLTKKAGRSDTTPATE